MTKAAMQSTPWQLPLGQLFLHDRQRLPGTGQGWDFPRQICLQSCVPSSQLLWVRTKEAMWLMLGHLKALTATLSYPAA